jgi:hypothetical protein
MRFGAFGAYEKSMTTKSLINGCRGIQALFRLDILGSQGSMGVMKIMERYGDSQVSFITLHSLQAWT